MERTENIEGIKKRLWKAADTLRANSGLASNEYFMPVMGLLFLRHAYSRYLAVKDKVEAALPVRNGRKRKPTKEDFSRVNAILLRKEAQFDYLVGLSDDRDRAGAIVGAMESIEEQYSSLCGILPKDEYRKLDNEVLGQLLRIFNPDYLKRVSGDVFGGIYEYFLTKFADQKAHDGGEFFTPASLVSLIARVLDPQRGTVLDPACGSGGMFVQSARTVGEHGQSPAKRLTFRGMEKNESTIVLAKMNLAVHGLEGDVQQANTYQDDPHGLAGKADYVMANPPFNVDQIDAGKIGGDPRLRFGLPGVNKEGKVSNGNYVWISYFYGYLSERGRAGFVMSSQASSAGRDEAKVRRKLIETGDVDIMIAIRSNFFYTRTVPCELWFLNRDKPKKHRDKVLMIDARNIYSELVQRRIYHFSPEQQMNLLSIVWLYRGETGRYLNLVADYCSRVVNEGMACFGAEDESGAVVKPLPDFLAALTALIDTMVPFFKTETRTQGPQKELTDALQVFGADMEAFWKAVEEKRVAWEKGRTDNTDSSLRKAIDRLVPLTNESEGLIRQVELLGKLAVRLIEICEKEYNAKTNSQWNRREIARARDKSDASREQVVKQLERVRYFWQQAHWLTNRFPDAKLCDVEGLVKLVNHADIEANDWSLTPGRYVGVAAEEEGEGFNFEQAMRDVHAELEKLNAEAGKLAVKIQENFKGLGI